MKIHILPHFRGEDKGDGGIRRVVEAQERYLPALGYEITPSIDEADLVATHAGNRPSVAPGKPWVVHCHGLYWSEYQWANWHYSLNADVVEAMRQADAVTAPSRWVAHALRRNMWLRPEVLYHGVDLEDWPYQPVPPDDYILWNKSRPDPVCDPWPVVELAAKMPRSHFMTTFVPEVDSIPNNITATGPLPFLDAKGTVQRAGVYLCITRETFGIGTLEAMASGVPVVGWDWGGQHEFIQHQKTGWLATPGDIDGLVAGIRWAMENRQSVTRAARQDVEARFQWEHRIIAYDELYQDLLERFEAPRPKVSVVVPSYNLGRYLPAAVNSVQKQTLTDWEMVIVDDCSTDNSREVADELAANDERIRVVSPAHNLYLAGALNFGISQAAGDYIVPLDADNGLAPRALEFLAAGLDATREIDIAYGQVQFIKEDGTPDRSIGENGVSGWPQDFQFGQQMMQRNQLPSTSMYRRRVWERTGGYRRRWKTSEDADFWTRAVSIGFKPERVTRGVTLIYRLREGQMSAVNTIPNYAGWYPWSRDKALVLPAAPVEPPREINRGLCWHFPSYERPSVSVIIPVGPGHGELVIDALDSVEAQTFREWEVVVVNDTGGDLHIPHPWAKVVDAKKANIHGPGAARNIGVLASTAPLLVFLDADDFLQPNALTDMVDAWSKGQGVIYGQWWDDKGDGRIELYDPPEFDPGLLIRSGCIHGVTCLLSRNDFYRVNGFDPDLSHWEDWDLQIKLASQGICGTKLETPLFTYRKSTGRRRDANVRDFDQGKEAILSKWSRVWDHPEAFMAGCGGCPGGGGIKTKAAPGRLALMNREAEGLVLIEYTGTQQGVQTFRPPQSQGYRFGASGSNRFSWVYPEHVEWFLQRGQFRKAEVPEPNPVPDRLETPMTQVNSLADLNGTVSMAPSPDAALMADEVADRLVFDMDPSEAPTIEGASVFGVDVPASAITAGEQKISVSFDPQTIDQWTPSPLRKIIDSIDPETASVALSNEKQGRNRQDVVKLLNQRISRG